MQSERLTTHPLPVFRQGEGKGEGHHDARTASRIDALVRSQGEERTREASARSVASIRANRQPNALRRHERSGIVIEEGRRY